MSGIPPEGVLLGISSPEGTVAKSLQAQDCQQGKIRQCLQQADNPEALTGARRSQGNCCTELCWGIT